MINVDRWIALGGYWGVLGLVALESAAIPIPAEAAMLSAAAYAGAKHTLHLPGLIAAAAAGAVLGDNIGYWIGHHSGTQLVRRFGPRFHLHPRALEIGRCIFLRHGGKLVFFGRFVAILRPWVALLAGVSRMPWKTFFPCNLAGAVTWATLYGSAAYYLGEGLRGFERPVAITAVLAAVATLLVGALILRRRGERWIGAALRAAPQGGAGQP